MRYCFYILFFVLTACSTNDKQENKTEPAPPFWSDIQHFKRQDSVSSPPANAILFIGSSSFTLWRDVQVYFPEYTIVNRGFGGSTLLDQIRYADKIIFPYQPKQIVIYCGENDLASSDSVTAAIAVDRFKQLFQMIRDKTEAHVTYISMKPSPSRRHLFSKMRAANAQIRDFLGTQQNVSFVDVHSVMLNKTGEPIPELFLEDSLHMNSKGYTLWQQLIKPHLIQ